MWTTVLILALMTATEPVRLGVAIFLISRPQPMVNLLAFWLGGMVMGIGVAASVLILLRDFASSLMQDVSFIVASPTVGHIQIALGVLALVVAALIAAGVSVRQTAPARTPG